MPAEASPPARNLTALALALCVLAASLLAAAPAAAAAVPSTLGPGGTLSAGQELASPDGHYDLVLQSDGNLVLYIAGGRALWASKTAGAVGDHAVMQTNGNFVLYDAGNQVLWSTNTSGANCGSLILQNDGNLVLYGPKGAAWATNTVNAVLAPGDKLTAGQELSSVSEHYKLIMQTDGNLVLYTSAGKALWSSGTVKHAGAYATMQTDGNLVVYPSSGPALWASNTVGKRGARLVLQDDGNLVIYLGSTALWASNTRQAGVRRAAAAPDARAVAADCGLPAPPPPTPTPAPTPPPPAQVVYVPVVVYVPAPRAPHHVKVRLTMSWTWDRGRTHLYRAVPDRVPRHATITVTCAGRGCPGRARLASLHVKRLLGSLSGNTYRAGDRVFITIRAPGEAPERIELWIRFGKKPRVKLL
ncbi:MAG TPA: hypothetical protein VG294_10375 [Solirubrobacteraceae bacterium]|jgi:hypothetical protein|nr:hypothetical protein [Solirubrobacteraceae bacterium]